MVPWDPDAPAAERFSPTYVPPTQGTGRFDLGGPFPGGVLYLAETPEHAVAEMIQHYRGQVLDDADLHIGGHRLALVAVTLPTHVRAGVIDLCDPTVLVQLGMRPDETASSDRRVTQRIAARVHGEGYAGLRWWSVLTGDWHTVVLFLDRLDPGPAYDAPEPLAMNHPRLLRDLGFAAHVEIGTA